MRKILAGAVIFFTGAAAAIVLTHGSLQAQDSGSESNIIAKLDEVVRGQQQVIETVNSMRDDIQVIKLRVTQAQ